jgi:hypothetical protein
MDAKVQIMMLPNSGTQRPFYVRGEADSVAKELNGIKLPHLLEILTVAAETNQSAVLQSTEIKSLKIGLLTSPAKEFEAQETIEIQSGDSVGAVMGKIKAWYHDHTNEIREGYLSNCPQKGGTSVVLRNVSDGFEVEFVKADAPERKSSTRFKKSAYAAAIGAAILGTGLVVLFRNQIQQTASKLIA